MDTQTIRRRFLDYFKKQHHTIVPSSPVIPYDDPTLMFVNAGMNQFKDIFLGEGTRDYTKATTSQKCVRVGGKHNDLENVGHTKRHLTFFEMLGNFSFGDYYKKEAIQFAWEVSTEVFGFDEQRIWPTIYKDDEEAFELWTKYVPASRITRFGEKDNFWSMGDVGPCGPCSELFFDRGPKFGPASTPLEDADMDGERFLEFWNLVFMQYNRQESQELITLPKPSIDTGSGIERVMSLIQDTETVFETDILRALIAEIEKFSGKTYDPSTTQLTPAFRVIADHTRTLAFAIADGAQPSNVDRGYVLRKILRRAVRYGRMLGFEKPFISKLLPKLVGLMGDDFPEIKNSQSRTEEILEIEEHAFLKTLQRGGNILNNIIDSATASKTHQISGDDAFKLKDTYGLPLDEILLIAKDANLSVDEKRFDKLEQEAKERSRKVHKSHKQLNVANIFEDFLKEHGETQFTGYLSTNSKNTKVIGILQGDQWKDRLEQGEEGAIILDQTPFYAEKGGQVGDTGILQASNTEFQVLDCQSPSGGITVHLGKLNKGTIQVNDTIEAQVSSTRRQNIANNHTATHLLHWALQEVLGPHIQQAGSYVDDKRIRFDFNHHKGVSKEEIQRIEDLVNEKVQSNQAIDAYELSYEEAQSTSDIKQFFGDKYGAVVRVVDIDYSKELCGGTHTSSTGNIGLFLIAKESSIAAGVRRIEAVTGSDALQQIRSYEQKIEEVANTIKSTPNKLLASVEKLLSDNKSMQQEIKGFQQKIVNQLVDDLINQVETVNGISLLTAKVALEPAQLNTFAESLMQKLSSGVLVVASAQENKCNIIARVTNDVIERGITANGIIKAISPSIKGGGGGKAQSAQAGGKNPQGIEEALMKTRELIEAQ